MGTETLTRSVQTAFASGEYATLGVAENIYAKYDALYSASTKTYLATTLSTGRAGTNVVTITGGGGRVDQGGTKGGG